MISKFKNKISVRRKKKILNFLDDLRTIGSGSNLNRLARIYKTDKFGRHFYTSHYKFHLKKWKFKKFNLLEIGVGGYDNPLAGGSSLRMWKRFFPFAKIYSIDIFDKSALQERRIKIFQGSQVDRQFLSDVLKKTGVLDIIIDDGSHINEHVIETFKILFPELKSGGVYVIEDTQTSYWEKFGGDSKDLNNPNTMVNYFKGFIHGLNHEEFIHPGYVANYFDLNIKSIHFYHNLIFIYKGDNKEGSNMVKDNQFK